MPDPIARSYLSAAGREELPALTGLRILAALAVAIWHAGHFMPAMPAVFNHFYLGVDLFFILSGFIIAHVYWRDFLQPTRQTYFRFLALRLARLWPAHVAVILLLLAAIAAAALMGRGNADWRALAPEIGLHLLLAHNWGETRLNFPSWSVSAEFFAYLLFPLQVMLFRRIEHPVLLALSLPLAVLLCWLGITVAFGAPLSHAGPIAFIRVVCEFAMGVALWRLWQSGAADRLPSTALVWPSLAGMILIAALTPSWHALDYAIVLLMAPLLLGLAHQPGPGLLASRPMVYLGGISYSVYLMHWPADLVMRALVSWLSPLLDGRRQGWDIVAGSMLLALLGGGVLFHLVEKPARLFLRTRIERHMPALRPVAA
ncbi:MAG: acyltransferase 3 [Alphaproteobacteria bacterium]|nr:acyltransferase 3 [Alphaproteobacteria bacterium]